MSKAFQCDNCGELFAGSPCEIIDGHDFCHNCIRVFKTFGTIDPFEKNNRNNLKGTDHE